MKVLSVLYLSHIIGPIIVPGLSSRLKNYETLHHSDLRGYSDISRTKREVFSEHRSKPVAIERLTLTTSDR